MRLAEGIVIDDKLTFGELKFSSIRRETYKNDEDGNRTEAVKGRVYDLKSREQGRMIQVTLPPDTPTRKFDYNQVVTLVEPEISTIANTRGTGGAESGWFLEAKDIVAAHSTTPNKPQQPVKPNNDKK